LDTKPNIIITGFMGTGKTTVAKQVAEKLARPFVDTDDAIVEQAGKPIAQIFADDGEAAFRHYERRVCRFYAGQGGYVIATGGGMLVDPDNLAVMQASGLVICLVASKAVIKSRLQHETGRPLVNNDWENLYDQRLDAYAAIPHQIDTSDLTSDDVTKEVIALWERESR
jgi:shikimate kinase